MWNLGRCCGKALVQLNFEVGICLGILEVAMSLPATISTAKKPSADDVVVQLQNGDQANQKTFHAWYETTPAKFKVELIGGEVFVPSPLKVPHSDHHAKVVFWLVHYEMETPGTKCPGQRH